MLMSERNSYRMLLLAHHGISYEDYGISVIRALVLAKVVLVAETYVWVGDMKKSL
jgi:hypothetical protein